MPRAARSCSRCFFDVICASAWPTGTQAVRVVEIDTTNTLKKKNGKSREFFEFSDFFGTRARQDRQIIDKKTVAQFKGAFGHRRRRHLGARVSRCRGRATASKLTPNARATSR